MIRVRIILGEQVKNEFAFLECQHLFLILFSYISDFSDMGQLFYP